MTDRRLAAVAFAALLVLSLPAPAAAFIASEDVLTSQTVAEFDLDPTNNPPDVSIRRHGADSDPSWLVTVDNGSMSSLEDWVNSSDDRAFVEQDNRSNGSDWAVVRAPADHVGVTILARLLGDGLVTRDYVQEVAVNRELSYAAPVENLRNASDVDAPGSRIHQLRASWGDGGYGTAGIAFDENAEETTMNETVNQTGADNVNATGDGIVVAVVDTGVNTANGNLFGNGTSSANVSRIDNASKDFIDGGSVNASNDNYTAIEDPNGHGTWVASSIAANSTSDWADGMAPNATIMGLRVLDEDGSGSTANIVQAIRHAADNDADVISMSLGSPLYSESLCGAIDYAFDQGVSSVVVAAGNSRQTTRWVATPADCQEPGVITVAATNVSDDRDNTSVAYFSQLGDDPGSGDGSLGQSEGADITVGAPGMEVKAKTASESGSVSNETLSGTSMATPHVSGAIALALEKHSWDGEEREIHDRVANSSRPAPDAASREIGNGLLAADNLNDSVSPNDQQSMQSDRAQARDDFWKGLSDAQGGILARAWPFSALGVAG